MKISSIVENFFKDKDGKVVIAQFPNVPLIGWFIFLILSKLNFQDQWSDILVFLSSAFLFTWAYLEITEGVNYFRRLLGVAGMIFVIVTLI